MGQYQRYFFKDFFDNTGEVVINIVFGRTVLLLIPMPVGNSHLQGSDGIFWLL